MDDDTLATEARYPDLVVTVGPDDTILHLDANVYEALNGAGVDDDELQEYADQMADPQADEDQMRTIAARWVTLT